MNNSISFLVKGRYALFTDPLTKLGGEKCTYHVPTYEALKGIAKSIYWKPTFIWHIDKVRIMKPLRTQAKAIRPIKWTGGNDLAIYTYLYDVEYQVQAHFEWNSHRPELEHDRISGKHYTIATTALQRGGRQDIFLGTRECQAYVEPCTYGDGESKYDDLDELSFGLMFHSFGYPDETGTDSLTAYFWNYTMRHGELCFPKQSECKNRFVRKMTAKKFGIGESLKPVEDDAEELI